MKAGDAIVYHHALLHYSPPNKSAVSQPALNLSVALTDVSLVHYCKPEEAADMEVKEVKDSSFYIRIITFSVLKRVT